MPKPADKLANQLKALEQLMERFPANKAELAEMHGEIAAGSIMPGTPMKVAPRSGEDPSVTRKARQMQFLEELGKQYPDKSKTILEIKDNLAKGNEEEEDEFEPASPTPIITGTN